MLFRSITHNYTLQKSQHMNGRKQVFPEAEDDKTELLSITEDERTELLPVEDDDRTELLSENEQTSSIPHIQESIGNLPEYARFFGKGINARSDIYSLGVTLYYMLTGIEPPADFKQRIPIGEANRQVSEGFAIILEKMMALPPQERYADGKEYLKAIRNCHKLDHRYIVMHRKQTGIQIAALGSLDRKSVV